MPKVSIIVAAYNVEPYIEKCINSLLCQTLKEIEIIVVNDGSKDSTSAKIEKYTDPRIVYKYKWNGGLSDARNFGLKFVTGDYVAFVDGDDFVQPDMYEKLYKKAIEDGADLVECGYFMDYPDYTIEKLNMRQNLSKVLFKPYNQWNKLIKTSLIKDNKLEFKKGLWYEDFNFNLKLASYVTKVSYVDECLYHYLQRDGSIMHTVKPKIKDIYDVIDDVVDFYKTSGKYDEYYKDLEYIFVKELLISSGKRFLEYDKQNETSWFKDNYSYVNNNYPKWRCNDNLRNRGSVNIVLKLLNKMTYKLILRIL